MMTESLRSFDGAPGVCFLVMRDGGALVITGVDTANGDWRTWPVPEMSVRCAVWTARAMAFWSRRGVKL